jgi:hypothetical protein
MQHMTEAESEQELEEMMNELSAHFDAGVRPELSPALATISKARRPSSSIPHKRKSATAFDEHERARQPNDYSFPLVPTRPYGSATHVELVAHLETLVVDGFEQQRSARLPTKYADVRVALCQVSLELNFRQALAPRFRHLPTPAWKAVTRNEVDYALDLQIVDLHWRAHSKRKPKSPISNYPGLFANSPFDFSVAEAFARRTLPKDMKVTDARLTASMTIEHTLLQTTAQSEKWRLVRNGYVRGADVERLGIPHVQAYLEESVLRQPHLAKHVPNWVDIWTACRLVGEEPSDVAALVALMTGTEVADVSATKRKIVAVNCRLARLH